MEEMSWGQILFNWDTPAGISLINAQKEINIHNIRIIHRYVDLVYGIILGLVIIISLAGRSKITSHMKHSFAELISLISPSKLLLVYFLPVFIFILFLYFDLYTHTQGLIFKGEEEVAEMLGAFGLLGYSVAMLSKFSEIKNN